MPFTPIADNKIQAEKICIICNISNNNHYITDNNHTLFRHEISTNRTTLFGDAIDLLGRLRSGKATKASGPGGEFTGHRYLRNHEPNASFPGSSVRVGISRMDRQAVAVSGGSGSGESFGLFRGRAGQYDQSDQDHLFDTQKSES